MTNLIGYYYNGLTTPIVNGGVMRINTCAPSLPLELSREAEDMVVAQMRQPNIHATEDVQAIRRLPDLRTTDSLRRPAYLRDIEKIVHIPPYNRLAGKTQVFSFRDNDDFTRRGLHVQLVSRVARDIGRALGLNLDLIEAIALGHDIGHTPFGHAGERYLNDVYHKHTGGYFLHNVQSVRVLDVMYGRNLTLQTLDGIICHNGEFEQQKFRTSDLATFEEFDERVSGCWQEGHPAVKKMIPMTLEGCVVRISDIIAYVGKDRQDAIKAGLCTEDTFDDGLGGQYNSWALAAFTTDVIENSIGKNAIEMSEEGFCELRRAKRENFEKIYMHGEVNGVCSESIKNLFGMLYEHELDMLKQGDERSAIFKHHVKPIEEQLSFYDKTYDWQDSLDLCVVDFISSMTDKYFMSMCSKLFAGSEDLFPYRGYFDRVPDDLL